MTVDRGTVHENMPADITDTPSQYWMMVMYLLFVDHAGNGHSDSLHGPEPHTMAVGESDTRLSSCTRCSKTTCPVICVSYIMEGKMGDGEYC